MIVARPGDRFRLVVDVAKIRTDDIVILHIDALNHRLLCSCLYQRANVTQ